ncbi:hypothetical protein HUG20_17955 [Salicibibacter cibi]|uniref:Uncharacterized protein n=1 Tax=Salicibibacter cibi TaxID=2743001 RepID=A0A7T6ZE51_9BACI|nr:hypothetical protein [Salicibibacter cibi]QQK81612.1 hypothetical protein HUG20_17955 [Salicibibacter cibi]
MEKKVEAILWSIALPGFAQLLSRNYVKGILLILIEIIVNVQGNLNTLIVLSFQGHTQEAVQQADYLWIMFYPCLYFFAIWDAYKNAGGDEKPYMAVPFASAAFITTIGVAYSSQAIMGVVVGPIFLPILSSFVGLGLGFATRIIIRDC